jgi:hypothetical protein
VNKRTIEKWDPNLGFTVGALSFVKKMEKEGQKGAGDFLKHWRAIDTDIITWQNPYKEGTDDHDTWRIQYYDGQRYAAELMAKCGLYFWDNDGDDNERKSSMNQKSAEESGMSQQEARNAFCGGTKVRKRTWSPGQYVCKNGSNAAYRASSLDQLFGKDEGDDRDWEVYTPINPGEGYRLLDGDEAVMKGDEFLSDSGRWLESGNYCGNYRDGKQAEAVYRRPVAPPLMDENEVRKRVLVEWWDPHTVSIINWKRKKFADNYLEMEYVGACSTCAMCVANNVVSCPSHGCKNCILHSCDEGSLYEAVEKAFADRNYPAYLEACDDLIAALEEGEKENKTIKGITLGTRALTPPADHMEITLKVPCSTEVLQESCDVLKECYRVLTSHAYSCNKAPIECAEDLAGRCRKALDTLRGVTNGHEG